MQKGLLVVISGPSGTGKGTVCKMIFEQRDNIKYSVSATTRKPREGEIDGKNYFFVTEKVFLDMLRKDELLEWDKYCDNYYGTPKNYVEQCLNDGVDIVLEITVEGAINIKKKYPECVLIFILPPSYDELRKRIVGRGTEEFEIIEKRLEQAKNEMKFVYKYDYAVINDDLQEAVNDIETILTAERLKPDRNVDVLNKFLK